MAGVAGIALQEKLHDFHLAHVGRVVESVMKEHEADGCRFAKGAYERTMAWGLAVLREALAAKLEEEEVACPHRGIGVKEAA